MSLTTDDGSPPTGTIAVPAELTPRGSGQSAPARRPGSVRRTSTIDFTWPAGPLDEARLDGRVRDLYTPLTGEPVVVDDAGLLVVTDGRRVITEIMSRPDRPQLQALVGESSMSGFRKRLAPLVADDAAAGTPLHFLLDDVPGSTLVSGTAYRRWYGLDRYLALRSDVGSRVMTDVCTGYQQGSGALNPDGTLRWEQIRGPAVEIDDVDDPMGWHEHARHDGISMRRARRIDVWLDGPVVRIDAFYQDSATLPEGGRISIHEYAVTAEADLHSLTLRAVHPIARVLPYNECPLATLNTVSLVGEPLAMLRPTVLETLKGPQGCTHLNDTLRSLADVPTVLRPLLDGGA